MSEESPVSDVTLPAEPAATYRPLNPRKGQPAGPVEPGKRPRGRPKGYKVGQPAAVEQIAQVAVQQVGIAPTADQWTQLIAALTTNKLADVEAAATIHAHAMKKALRPENEIAPAISVYNPKGETQFPRPKPTQIYMMARYPICDPGNYDTTTWTEIELLNQLKGGEYTITKSDGLDVKVLVKAEHDSAGRPSKMTLFADGQGLQDDEQKNNWPPMLQILTQMVTGESPMQSYTRYQAIIDRQAAELAALRPQSVAAEAVI